MQHLQRGLSLRRSLIGTLRDAGASDSRSACIADGALKLLGAGRFEELDRIATENPESPQRAELEAAGSKAADACP